MKASEVINIDKDILGGTPVFRGTRVPIQNLFDYLAAGDCLDDLLNDFDYIPKAHCLLVKTTLDSGGVELWAILRWCPLKHSQLF